MTRVLLVTGARSLADDPAAEAWARGLIAEALAGVGLLIVGDAPGPDAWAWEIAEGTVRERRRYCVRGDHAGDVRVRYRAVGAADARWATWRWTPQGASTHPLARNAAMVDDAVEVTHRRHLILGAIALLDGRKASATGRVTRGTEHTLGLARRAGLTVTALTWPDDAPGGEP